MSILTQAMIFERYGPRLDVGQLAELLGIAKGTLYNQISSKRCPVKTYVEAGTRYADFRDVAEHFDKLRAMAR